MYRLSSGLLKEEKMQYGSLQLLKASVSAALVGTWLYSKGAQNKGGWKFKTE